MQTLVRVIVASDMVWLYRHLLRMKRYRAIRTAADHYVTVPRCYVIRTLTMNTVATTALQK
jgi:hypothetical protein